MDYSGFKYCKVPCQPGAEPKPNCYLQPIALLLSSKISWAMGQLDMGTPREYVCHLLPYTHTLSCVLMVWWSRERVDH